MSANPNPARISGPIWGLWDRLHAHDPRLQLGGIFAPKGGYHDERDACSPFDYSRAEVAADRRGPGDKASAIDLTPAGDDAQAKMRLYTSRLDAAARARDERLFIDGVPIIREFIGTKNNTSVYCYVLTGGRARGLPADAGPDYGRDATHLWHVHISIIRQFCAHAGAMDRLYSVLSGESLAAWKARTAPAPLESSEDDMSQQVIPIPRGFAYTADGTIIDKTAMVSVPAEPAGLPGHHLMAGRRMYLSFSTDHTGPQKILVRMAVHDGKGFQVKVHEITAGGREPIPVPPARGDSAFNITLGRVQTEFADAAVLPLSLLVTVV